MNTRRDFLRDSMLLGAATAIAGCAADRFGSAGAGGAMYGYADKPMERIRVGFVGVGKRGFAAVRRCAWLIPYLEATAVCDIDDWKCDRCAQFALDHGLNPPKKYVGPEAYKALCDDSDVDVVYNIASREMHLPINLYGMRAGKHVMTEVPGAMTVDGCWETVETSERTRCHCMLLENCCYGEFELLAMSLAKAGRLGEVVHGDCGYIHEQRDLFRRMPERVKDTVNRTGNWYPTHGIGPVAVAMDINRGDRFDYLVSAETDSISFREYQLRRFADDPAKRDVRMKHGDLNTSIVRTVNGKTIMVQHDVGLARPYSRIGQFCGTRGMLRIFPDFRLALETVPPQDGMIGYLGEKEAERIRREYMHPLWKTAGIHARTLDGGHDGMDFLMDLRWAHCLHEGLPLDMSVYDLASWSSLVELTARSVQNRSAAVDVPDFTRGGWKEASPFELWNVPASILPALDTPRIDQDI